MHELVEHRKRQANGVRHIVQHFPRINASFPGQRGYRSDPGLTPGRVGGDAFDQSRVAEHDDLDVLVAAALAGVGEGIAVESHGNPLRLAQLGVGVGAVIGAPDGVEGCHVGPGGGSRRGIGCEVVVAAVDCEDVCDQGVVVGERPWDVVCGRGVFACFGFRLRISGMVDRNRRRYVVENPGGFSLPPSWLLEFRLTCNVRPVCRASSWKAALHRVVGAMGEILDNCGRCVGHHLIGLRHGGLYHGGLVHMVR